MPKLCVQLTGGLGNQMFQYAVGRAIALDQNMDFAIDVWSGFVRDKEYRRKYELNLLSIQPGLISLGERAALWLYRASNGLQSAATEMRQNRWYADFYVEREFAFHSDLPSGPLSRLTWLIGYWQSPKYFQQHCGILRAELFPKPPSGKEFQTLGQRMQSCESVALGVRLYEESKNPASHAYLGRTKSVNDINRAIQRLIDKRQNLQFYVFCTHQSALFNQLDLPANTIFVTPENGYEDSVDCLWLLTQCKHHIFTNSSYYWWGAWLSHSIHNPAEQLIFAADNFINIDGLCEHWDTF